VSLCDREFDKGASIVLELLHEVNKHDSYDLLTRELPAWGRQNLFSLADCVGESDFVNNHCCQTKLDRIWVGETAPTASILTVGGRAFQFGQKPKKSFDLIRFGNLINLPLVH